MTNLEKLTHYVEEMSDRKFLEFDRLTMSMFKARRMFHQLLQHAPHPIGSALFIKTYLRLYSPHAVCYYLRDNDGLPLEITAHKQAQQQTSQNQEGEKVLILQQTLYLNPYTALFHREGENIMLVLHDYHRIESFMKPNEAHGPSNTPISFGPHLASTLHIYRHIVDYKVIASTSFMPLIWLCHRVIKALRVTSKLLRRIQSQLAHVPPRELVWLYEDMLKATKDLEEEDE